ncbi:hypothetical protein HCJ99_29535, partial [Streptomyces sp. C1-2]|nr:hypothetical protein [Streptomyces sp. C1-2]
LTLFPSPTLSRSAALGGAGGWGAPPPPGRPPPGASGTYGGYSYDAATAIIKAVGEVVKDGKVPDDARQQIVDQVQKVKFEGIAGPVAFDEYGDTTNKQLTVYQVKDGKWKAVKSGTYDAG